MNTRTLGTSGPTVSALGLGLMGMSDFYGPADEKESVATVHAALEAGVTLLDTGDFYGMGHNELLLRDALRGTDRDRVVISVKFGALRGPDGGWLGFDARPAAVTSDRRPADRVLPAVAGDRGRDPAGGPGAGHRRHGLWRAVPRAAERALDGGAGSDRR